MHLCCFCFGFARIWRWLVVWCALRRLSRKLRLQILQALRMVCPNTSMAWILRGRFWVQHQRCLAKNVLQMNKVVPIVLRCALMSWSFPKYTLERVCQLQDMDALWSFPLHLRSSLEVFWWLLWNYLPCKCLCRLISLFRYLFQALFQFPNQFFRDTMFQVFRIFRQLEMVCG